MAVDDVSVLGKASGFLQGGCCLVLADRGACTCTVLE